MTKRIKAVDPDQILETEIVVIEKIGTDHIGNRGAEIGKGEHHRVAEPDDAEHDGDQDALMNEEVGHVSGARAEGNAA